jgi:hypothetical protein
MELLEVELDLQEPISLLKAINKFVGREVIIEDAVQGELKGIIVARKGRKNYVFKTYPDKSSVKDYTLDYRDLKKMTLVSPRKEDYRRARVGYMEVTQGTITETLKWAKRVRT